MPAAQVVQVTGVVAGSQAWQLKMTVPQARQLLVAESRKRLALESQVQTPAIKAEVRLLTQAVQVERSEQAVQREGQAVQEVVG